MKEKDERKFAMNNKRLSAENIRGPALESGEKLKRVNKIVCYFFIVDSSRYEKLQR